MEEELVINLNNHECNFQVPIIIEDIEIIVEKEKDDKNFMTIIFTDNLGKYYTGRVLMIFPTEDGKNPNILWIHLIDKSNNGNVISLTYHWFENCLFEQALKKVNLSFEKFYKIFMEVQ